MLEGKNNTFPLLWEIKDLLLCKMVSLFQHSNMAAVKTLYMDARYMLDNVC